MACRGSGVRVPSGPPHESLQLLVSRRLSLCLIVASGGVLRASVGVVTILSNDAVTQFAVLDALLAGAYETGMPVADALRAGDVGIGCCDRLGG